MIWPAPATADVLPAPPVVDSQASIAERIARRQAEDAAMFGSLSGELRYRPI